MLVGRPYLESTQRRGLDLALATAFLPAREVTRGVAAATFLRGEDVRYVSDERVGKGSTPFLLRKLATQAAGGQFERLAHFYRGAGLDELEQVENVLSGDMSFFGARPIRACDHEAIHDALSRTNEGRELLAEHEDIVMPYPPGIISTFGLRVHYEASAPPEVRLRMNIKDCKQASVLHDFSLLAACAGGLTKKIKHTIARKG